MARVFLALALVCIALAVNWGPSSPSRDLQVRGTSTVGATRTPVGVDPARVDPAGFLPGGSTGADAKDRRSPPPDWSPADQPKPASEPVEVRIPSLGVHADITGLGVEDNGKMQVPGRAEVAGWYTHAPTPGELGPAIIAAHVDWNGRPGVFADLKRLREGDRVLVRRADGSTARFAVTALEQHPKTQFPTEKVYGNIDHPGLRLITCGGEFDQSADSYDENVIAYGRLIAGS